MGDLIVLIPLGVIGLIRWLSWLVRRIPAVLYTSYESNHRAPMSLVTPVYQEDPELFRQAIESWLANDLTEIICVIDQTDKSSIEVAKRYPVKIIVTDVPGKRDALRKGWEAATSPIVALVDSDTLWARDAREQILKPFEDPRIGGVGTRQNVYNPENIWQNINDMYLDYRYFDEIASQTRVSRAVSCLSGRTAAYRRDLLLEVSDDFIGETFLGVPCNSGEDKRLTSLILERGHQTYMQRNARVWSAFPRDPSTFFKQRLRWSRNTWRSDLRALKRRWIFRYKFLAFTTIDKAVASFTLMIAPAYMIWALFNQNWGLVSALAVWWIVSRAAKHLPHLHRKPLHFLIIPIFVLVSFAVALVKIYALLTLRKQRWLTRQVEVVDGEIVRTGNENESMAAEIDVRERADQHDQPDVLQEDPDTENDGERTAEPVGVAADRSGRRRKRAVARRSAATSTPEATEPRSPQSEPSPETVEREATLPEFEPVPEPISAEFDPVSEPIAAEVDAVSESVPAEPDPVREPIAAEVDAVSESVAAEPDPVPAPSDPISEPVVAATVPPSKPPAAPGVDAIPSAPPPTGRPMPGLAPPSPPSPVDAMAAITQRIPLPGSDGNDSGQVQDREELVDALLADLVDLPRRGPRRPQLRFDEEEGA